MKKLLGDVTYKSYDVNFANIIKNSTIFTKTTIEDPKKFKRSRIYALKCNLYCIS